MRKEPPFGAIMKLVEYLENNCELRHYCEMVGDGGDGAHEHIYRHVIAVLEWMSEHGGAYTGVAQDFLDCANERITEAKSEADATWAGVAEERRTD